MDRYACQSQIIYHKPTSQDNIFGNLFGQPGQRAADVQNLALARQHVYNIPFFLSNILLCQLLRILHQKHPYKQRRTGKKALN